MRVVLCLVLLTSLAHADATALQKLVRQNIIELGNLADDPALGLADDAIVIDQMGRRIDLSEEDGCVEGAVANRFYGCNQSTITHKPGSIDVGVDMPKGFGWFQAPFTVLSVGEDENGKPVKSREAMRTMGIAQHDGKGWKIVAQLYTLPVPDAKLAASGKPAPATPKITGDAKLAKAVASWFASGFKPHAGAAAVSLHVSGTSAKEQAWGDAAMKLVGTFDKLKIAPVAIHAKLLANGKVGWVLVDVVMPRRKSKQTVEMKLAIVAVPHGDSWRWVSLGYQYAWQPWAR